MVSKGENAHSTSLGLLKGLQANEPAAWKRLVELYGPLLDHWCRSAELQEADVADVRQEVFLAVTRKMGEFQRQATTGSFRGWLRTITRHKIADLGRRGRAHPAGTGCDRQLGQMAAKPDAGEVDNAEAVLESRILYRRALALIQEDFEESTWKAFLGVVIDGRSAVDVAADLGVSVNVVYLAKSRVLARLREEFTAVLDK
jgi:RNA polymerase sigma-70 factor (ECF subfamily)